MINKAMIINGKYKVIRLLGQGGMARVWLAEEIKMGNRQVAIKEPLPGISEEENTILKARFERELKVCGELVKAEVPQVVNVLTVEPYNTGDLLVMEYMPGSDLANRIANNPKGMLIEEAVDVSTNILKALIGIHNHPLAIIHRDIKPSNILFSSKGKAYLGDFGLSQMSRASGVLTQVLGNRTVVFTPAYRAPELSNPDDFASYSSDLYSFGCVLWEMLTGQLYKSQKPGTMPSEINQNVPVWLDKIVVQCLEVDPWSRPKSASDILQMFTTQEVGCLRNRDQKPPSKVIIGKESVGRSVLQIENSDQTTNQISQLVLKAKELAEKEPAESRRILHQILVIDPNYPIDDIQKRISQKEEETWREEIETQIKDFVASSQFDQAYKALDKLKKHDSSQSNIKQIESSILSSEIKILMDLLVVKVKQDQNYQKVKRLLDLRISRLGDVDPELSHKMQPNFDSVRKSLVKVELGREIDRAYQAKDIKQLEKINKKVGGQDGFTSFEIQEVVDTVQLKISMLQTDESFRKLDRTFRKTKRTTNKAINGAAFDNFVDANRSAIRTIAQGVVGILGVFTLLFMAGGEMTYFIVLAISTVVAAILFLVILNR